MRIIACTVAPIAYRMAAVPSERRMAQVTAVTPAPTRSAVAGADHVTPPSLESLYRMFAPSYQATSALEVCAFRPRRGVALAASWLVQLE